MGTDGQEEGREACPSRYYGLPEQKLRDLAEAYAAFRGLKLLGVSFE